MLILSPVSAPNHTYNVKVMRIKEVITNLRSSLLLNKCIENSMENMHTIIIGCEGSKGMQKLVIKNVSKSLMCKASMESGLKVSIPMSMDERNHFSHV